MLTNEQCIEIAEKVWGYTYKPDGAGKDSAGYGEPIPYFLKTWDEGYSEILFCEIQDEVNSWEGFGRTVEAMAERKWVLSDSSMTGICFYSHVGKESPVKVTDDWNNPRDLIEATHLAALEAKK